MVCVLSSGFAVVMAWVTICVSSLASSDQDCYNGWFNCGLGFRMKSLENLVCCFVDLFLPIDFFLTLLFLVAIAFSYCCAWTFSVGCLWNTNNTLRGLVLGPKAISSISSWNNLLLITFITLSTMMLLSNTISVYFFWLYKCHI